MSRPRAWREAADAAYRMVLDEGMDPEAVAGALEAQGYAGWTARRVARSVDARYRAREGHRLSWAQVLAQPMIPLAESANPERD